MVQSCLLTSRVLTGILLGILGQCLFPAAEAQERVPTLPPVMSEIPGKLLIVGGGPMPRYLMDRFVDEAGGKDAKIVVITTASVYAGTPEGLERMPYFRERLQDGISITFLHTRSRSEATTAEFSHPLDDATGVWFVGGNQNFVTEVYLGTEVEKKCHAVLSRGGIIGGTSAGAAIMSRVMICGGVKEPSLSLGLGFLPGAIVDQHFLKRKREDRLLNAMSRHPGHFGIGVDESTALFVSNRTIEVLGESEVRVYLTPNRDRGRLTVELKPGQKIDPIAYQIAALSRVQCDRYSQCHETPELGDGTLVLAGPGKPPQEAIHQFIQSAGGAEASLVVLCESQSEGFDRSLREAGAKNLMVFRPKTRSDLHDPQLISQLKKARGVWLDGLKEWKLVDMMVDSPAHDQVRQVLRRGGVIGGANAAAAVQGDMVLATSETKQELTAESPAEAYERGFGLLPGVTFEPSTTTVDSAPEIEQMKTRFPQMVGLEIEDSTALIVKGHVLQVVGENDVKVYDTSSSAPKPKSRMDRCILKPGDRYDLKQHQTVTGKTPAVSNISFDRSANIVDMK